MVSQVTWSERLHEDSRAGHYRLSRSHCLYLYRSSMPSRTTQNTQTVPPAWALAARFRQLWPILWGLLIVTLTHHAHAGAVGAWTQVMLDRLCRQAVSGFPRESNSVACVFELARRVNACL